MKLPQTPPTIEILPDSDGESEILQSGKYLHWDKFRHYDPPGELTSEQWWASVKGVRRTLYQQLPLVDKQGNPFQYIVIEPFQKLIYQFGRGGMGIQQDGTYLTPSDVKNSYYLRSLLKESITSSQLEGAATTRAVAKDMLLSGRTPETRHEWMIFNNYKAMEFIRQSKGEPLTPDLILELHRILTQQTMDDTLSVGRYRNASEQIRVVDPNSGTILHQPPKAGELAARMERLCNFANDDATVFMHPVLKAIALHFQIGYDHPFVDGNGRTARALFYWAMAKYDYWLAEYISISSELLKAPAKYAKAYLYTETDDNDLTYFFDYHIRVILQAIEELQLSRAKKSDDYEETELLLVQNRAFRQLNHRQIAIMGHARHHPDFLYTIESHRSANGLSYQTARTDLLELAGLGLLHQSKRGRAFVFLALRDLHKLVAEQ